MAVCDPDEGMHALFRGLLPEQHRRRSAADDEEHRAFDACWKASDGSPAIIVEPLVQGAGGMRFHDAAVLRRLRALADRYDLLLIFDEIFTGFGQVCCFYPF